MNKGEDIKNTKLVLADGSPALLKESPKAKILASENYKYMFNKRTGMFFRWGKTQREDGDLRLGLPEIADIEISTICSGLGIGCDFCYKSNIYSHLDVLFVRLLQQNSSDIANRKEGKGSEILLATHNILF